MLVSRSLLSLTAFSVALLSLAAAPARFEKKFQDLSPDTAYDTDWIFAPEDGARIGKVQVTLEGTGCKMVLDDFTYKPVQAGTVFKMVEKPGEPYPVDDIVTAFRVQFHVTRAAKECTVVILESPDKGATAPFVPAPIDTKPKWSTKEALKLSRGIYDNTTALQVFFVLVESKSIKDYTELNETTKRFHSEISQIYKDSWIGHSNAASHFGAADADLAKMVDAHKKLSPSYAKQLDPVWKEVNDDYAKLKNYFATTTP